MADGKVTIAVDLNDRGAKNGVRDLESNMRGLGDSAGKVSTKIGSLVTSLGVFKLISAGFDLIRSSMSSAIDRVDILNRFPLMMEAMGFSAEESTGSVNRLSEGIQGLPTRLDEVAATAQNIAILTGDLDMATDTTLALNNAFLASGATTDGAKRGLQQYVQMLSRGEVDMQSWRTLQETMGVALNDTAKAFGFTGRSAQVDLYDALKDGTITFDEFNAKIIELSETTGGFADRALIASRGIRTSFTNVRTAVVTGLANMIQTVDDAMQEGGFGSIADNLDRVKEAVQASFRELNDLLSTVLPPLFQGIIKLVEVVKELEPAFYGLAAAYLTFKVIAGASDFIYNMHFNFLLLQESVGKLFLLLKAHPFALIAAVIVGLIVALVRLWNTNEEFRNFVLNAWEQIKTVISNAVQGISEWLASMGITLQSVGEWFGEVAMKAGELGSRLIELAMGAVMSVVNWFRDLNITTESVREVFDRLRERVSELWSAFQETAVFQVLSGMFEMIKGKVTGFKDAFIELVTNFDFAPMLQQITEFIPKLVALFVSHKLGFMLMGIKLIGDIAEGMGMTVPELIETMADGIISVIETIAEQLPAVLMMGVEVLVALIEGIASALPQIIEVATTVLITFIEILLESIILLVDVGVQLLVAVIEGIVTVLPQIIEVGLEVLLTLILAIMEQLPQLLQVGVELLMALVEGLLSIVDVLVEAGIGLILALVESLIGMLPIIIDAGITLIMALVDGLVQMLPAIVDAGITLILELVSAIIEMLPALIDAGIRILLALVDGLIQMLPAIIEAATTLILALAGALIDMLPEIISAGWEILKALVGAIIELLPQLNEAGNTLVNALIDGVSEILSSVAEKGREVLKTLVSAILENIGDMLRAGGDLIVELIKGFDDKVRDVAAKGKEVAKAGLDAIKEFITDFAGVGRDLIEGLISGIGDKIRGARDKVVEVGSNILEGIKGRFRSNSPSKEMMDIGNDAIDGLIIGMEQMDSKVQNTSNSIVDQFLTMTRNIGTTVRTGFGDAVDNVRERMQSMADNARERLSSMRENFNESFNQISSIARERFGQVYDNVRSNLSNVDSTVVSRLRNVGSNFRNTFGSLRNSVSSGMGRVKSAVQSGMNGALSSITGMVGRFRTAGSNVASNIASGIRSGIGAVGSAVSRVTQTIRNHLPSSPAKEGPLKDMHKAKFGWAIANAIKGGERMIKSSLNDALTLPEPSFESFGSFNKGVRLPNVNRLGLMASDPTARRAVESNYNNRTVNNDNGTTIIIEKIENYTDTDIPRILEEARWIQERDRGEDE